MPSPPAGPRVLRSPDARASLRWIADQAQAHAERVRADPRELAEPLRVVVASRAQRLALSADLVRAAGRSLAGVEVRTLDGLALELLERSGAPVPRGERLAGLLAERAARAVTPLQDVLAELEEGFTAVRRGLGELLEAGLTPESARALLEQLEDDDEPAGPFPARRRAAALVRVALEVEQCREEHGAGGRPALLAAARAALLTHPPAAPERLLLRLDGEERGAPLDLLEDLVR
ncbi:MAG: hypothetical protein AAFZ65_12710, partial [Planctomycetota bacterium]